MLLGAASMLLLDLMGAWMLTPILSSSDS